MKGICIMSKKALLGGLLPLLTNPGTMIIAGAGILGWTVYEILSGKGEKNNGSDTVPDGSEPCHEPLGNDELAVEGTVIEQFETPEWAVEKTVTSSVKEPHFTTVSDDINEGPFKSDVISKEDAKKEMIRQAMSELGKRSAVARAKKKANTRKI